MPDGNHVPVLRQEAVAALAIRPEGTYVDATFGRGGHSAIILSHLGETGRLIAVDRDPDAEAEAIRWRDPRFQFHRAWFAELPDVLDRAEVSQVHGILFDLGVSSPQIDDPRRGFSFRTDGPLDMRMDPSRGKSVAQWLAQAGEQELKRVIFDYGEERLAQPIARAIVASRAQQPIERTRQLAAIVAKAVGSRRGDWSQDPATRTFQALRIFINQELAQLSIALEHAVARLLPGGRLAVISFHSLEDRPVKQFLRRMSQPFQGDARMARLPIATASLPEPPLRLVGRAITPSADEIEANPRARSAHLRVAERTQAALG